ncbi:MAG: efflux RND transporter permease subunit, partial [Planctomycetota bacterium]
DASTVGLAAIVQRAIRVAVLGLILFVGLVGLAGHGFTLLPTGFVPQEDEGYCVVNVQLPDGASQERTSRVVDFANEMIMDVPGVKDSLGITGFSLIDNSAGSNKASFFVTFEHWDDRPTAELSQQAIVANINQRVAAIQEAAAIGFEPPSLPGVGMAGGFSLALQDRGGSGLGMLEQVTNDFVIDGVAQPTIAGMFTGFRSNTPQLFIDIDREQVRKLDVPLSDVFGSLQAYLGSAYVNDFTRFGRIYQVRVQADASFRASPEDIRQLEVRSRRGKMIPLNTLFEVREVLGPQVVNHHNIYPSAKINGFTVPGVSSGDGMSLVRSIAAQKLPPTMGYEWTDLSYQEDLASGSTAIIFLFSILLVYLVLAAQYESWSLPLSVCFAVPTALLGAVAAVMLRDLDNNVYTQIGIVLLIGLSSKTAILIVEFAKVERDEGKSIAEAAIQATKLRFRAVLMTAFSFILGMLPLLVATGAGGASRQALGTTVFGGMVVATVVSVVTVPMLYFVIQWISEKLGGGRSRPDEPISDA